MTSNQSVNGFAGAFVDGSQLGDLCARESHGDALGGRLVRLIRAADWARHLDRLNAVDGNVTAMDLSARKNEPATVKQVQARDGHLVANSKRAHRWGLGQAHGLIDCEGGGLCGGGHKQSMPEKNKHVKQIYGAS